MQPKDFSEFVAGVPIAWQSKLIVGIVDQACEARLPGLEMSGSIAAVPLHLQYSVPAAAAGDSWLQGFVECAIKWVESYALDQVGMNTDRVSPLALLQIVKVGYVYVPCVLIEGFSHVSLLAVDHVHGCKWWSISAICVFSFGIQLSRGPCLRQVHDEVSKLHALPCN
jgi:hypothetical protein